MVVNEDRVETVFLAELRSLDYAVEGFVGRLKESASEPSLILHASVTSLFLLSQLTLSHDFFRNGKP